MEQHPDMSCADARALSEYAVRILTEKLALRVKLVSVKASALTDYYVIAYGRSSTHVRALADSVSDTFAASGVFTKRTEGMHTADWVLLDFGEIIVHVFSESAGEFYQFERLFKQESFIPIQDPIETTDQK